jgi:hypothetical protein
MKLTDNDGDLTDPRIFFEAKPVGQETRVGFANRGVRLARSGQPSADDPGHCGFEAVKIGSTT